ncbi:MAG TPA: hypothetical protein VGX26_10170 [Solirubrobacteraceae bacterium]|nr:hypothetical protein [Solirubrobacteraceae bacterium]
MPAIVMVMSLSTGIVVLYHGGNNPCWLFAEVYDDAQPAAREKVFAIEPLAIRGGIEDMEVRPCDSVEDRVDLVEQPRPLRSEMQVRAGIEHDAAPIRVNCAGRVISHKSLR